MSTYSSINSVNISSLAFVVAGSGNNEYVYVSPVGNDYTFYNYTGFEIREDQ